jgi:BMFP domain-containing protein YqiC
LKRKLKKLSDLTIRTQKETKLIQQRSAELEAQLKSFDEDEEFKKLEEVFSDFFAVRL